MSSSPGSPASRSSPRRRGRNTGSSPAATAPDTGTPVPGTPIAGTPRSERSPIVLTPSRGWASESSERDGSEVTDQAIIWGTTVNIQKAMEVFRHFFNDYRTPGDDDIEPHYRRLLSELTEKEEYALNIDCQALYEHSSECSRLYDQLVKYPPEIISIMDLVVNQEFQLLLKEKDMLQLTDEVPRVQVRLHNLKVVKRMRDMDPDDIDSLVAIRGMVIRTTSVIPDMRKAYFRCASCGDGVEVVIDRGRVNEPTVCEKCSKRHSMVLIHNRCTFKDKQLIKLQETPESIPEGETPHTISLYAFDELVDAVMPGDRVLITGVFRATTYRQNPRLTSISSVFRTHVDVIHFKKAESNRLHSEDPTAVDEESKQLFKEGDVTEAALAARRTRVVAMSRDDNLYENLSISLAPSIWELPDIKKGLLLQLFGGSNKDLGKQGRFRGEINVLLCGDPGTSKSQLLSFVHRISPRGMYTSGKGSSAVGLTAYVTKDPDTKEPILESGALVLSDRGICCIDEFDKMSDSTRSILHEVMEQQTVSIAKAGIICSLNARTSILASANPLESRYNPRLSVVENIQLPPTLLSRFDLIYLVLDNCKPETDRALAKHLVSLYYPPELQTMTAAPYTLNQLSEYISYAKSHVSPVITDEAFDELVSGYVAMRKLGMSGTKKTITATPRQLESLIRLAEAHAKLRLSPTVSADDVQEAIRLMNVATQQAATDPRTGTIDMSLITSGVRTVFDPEE